MEEFQQITSILALTMGASWASGINLYAAMAMLGLSSATGSFELPPDLQILENPLVIGASCAMYFVEFVTDKIPGVDSAWDSLHTFIRIPAGAMLAAGAVGEVGPAMEVAAAILGGGMATVSHATKAGSRVVINSSPEPFSNWVASITEDVAVIGGLWTALHQPLLFLGLLLLFILLVIWLLPKIGSAIAGIFRLIGRLFGIKSNAASVDNNNDAPPKNNASLDLNQLEQLKNLYDSGALTEQEFNTQKQVMLNNSNNNN